MIPKLNSATVKKALAASVLVFALAFFQKNKLPDRADILDEICREPVQTKITMQPFDVEKKGIVYTVNPLYAYELYGLVVSYHHSATWWDYYHQQGRDFLNVKDLCVVWGENAASGIYRSMKFQSGSWTCYYNFKPGTNRQEWGRFKGSCLGNNHLLVDDPLLRKRLMATRVGDQIHFKGYLATYSHGGGTYSRTTSTTRNDSGCEVVYLTDFKILKRGNPGWEFLFQASKYTLLVCVVLFFLCV